MATVPVYDLTYKQVEMLDLSDEVFSAEVKPHLFYEVVKAQLASRRQGTAAAKERAAVSGSTKKIYKQKGTGRARHGSIRAPIFVGGGRAHPPVPRDWSYRPPRKVRVQALKCALSQFVKEGKCRVVDCFQLPEIKTKAFLEIISRFQAGKRTLIVDHALNQHLKLAVRNCKEHQFLPPEGVNVFDLLRHDTLILSRAAIKALEARCLRDKKERTA
ncbi:50S ribosomal protein L4 [Pajaroellobacter abortibovis]|uniref:Large ribosomal subunit protein uL4 n=1 Tax=Pajaroellobacter abortibovis TaxID=1882918 RepID=A0A1L6MY32_9BACT|nr:50S ribosomal protein L4 [Pajaroellobacter abortibovis]APS00430.1 50S ribosomal protein L4 [Pajaroellobacter abortibovis]